MMSKTNIQRGFTIVELLIVIVVIGILAAITIVAYSGIQQRARDSIRTGDISSLQKALELYRVDNGIYPSVGADNTGYAVSSLAATLVPMYIPKLPNDPNSRLTNYQYVRGSAANAAYGIRISYESKTACHLGVGNAGIGWWGLQAC
jgi:general secretion pathway protein G